MNELIFFSHNKYKIIEILSIFKNSNINILTLNDFNCIIKPQENGKTFEENARIKSEFGFNYFGLPCFADDSGICIDALNNSPGIKSNRFQKKNGGYKKTFEIIINKAKSKKKFGAYFQTSIALTINYKKTIYFNGIVKGTISSTPLGSFGFHYDPIFIPNGTNKTFAQMSSEEKNTISHRYIATKKLREFLLESIN